MRLNGTYIMRDVAGEILVVPVGKTALKFNGMIILNPVSKVIWECLEKDTTPEQILAAVMEKFDVTYDEAKADLEEFLHDLRRQNMLTE